MNTNHPWILVWTSGHTISVSAIDMHQNDGTDSRTAAVYFSFDKPLKSPP